jgi:hypothetical protein
MIKLKNTPEQVELVKAIGSKDLVASKEAMAAFSNAIGPVIGQVLYQAGTASLIFNDYSFLEDESPSYPLDLYYGEGAGYNTVWSNSAMPGGLPTSEIYGAAEMKVTTYRLDSAVSFLKKYARKNNLNILEKAIERMINEVLIKQELQAWSVLLMALGQAATTVNGQSTPHTAAAGTAGLFLLADLSKLITLSKRINHSYADGTAVNPYSKGITDLFVSPEIKEQIRAFAYNPMNTRSVPNNNESTVLGLPDAIREEIYRSAGTSELFGISITDLNELGSAYGSQKYNTLFATFAQNGIAPGGTNFSASSNELLFGIDMTKQAALRFVETDNTGGTFNVVPDTQFDNVRQERLGFYGFLNEGRALLDARALMGLVV